MASGVHIPDVLDIGGMAVDAIIPAQPLTFNSWLAAGEENIPAGGTLLESQVQADVISADEEALLDDWLIADEDCTAAGSKMQRPNVSRQQGFGVAKREHSQLASGLRGNPPPASIDEGPHQQSSGAWSSQLMADVASIKPLPLRTEHGQPSSDTFDDDLEQFCAMMCEEPTLLGDQQHSGGNPWVQSPAPPSLPSPPPFPLPSNHPGSTPASRFPSASRSAVLPDPFASGSCLDTQPMQQPHLGASPRLPTLLTHSPAGLRQKADYSPAAFAGGSPGSPESATVAWGFFNGQAVSGQEQPQGHQHQGRYQEPCGQAATAQEQPQGHQLQGRHQKPSEDQSQQHWWQQGQGQHPEGPYQEPFQAQPLQEQLWGQSMTHQAHQAESLRGGSFSFEGPQDVRGKVYSPATAGVAAHRLHPLEARFSNASSASQASLQDAAFGGFTSQPRIYDQSLGHGVGTAPIAAMLPNVGSAVPLAGGCGQKRKAHQYQVQQVQLEDLDEAAVDKILADLLAVPCMLGACWTESAGNDGSAAYAHGQHMQPGDMAHMAQVQAIAQQLLPAAAALETKQPEKKQRTGQSSSSPRAVYWAPVPDAAHGPTPGPTPFAAARLAQGHPDAGPSLRAKHGYSSRAPPPGPPQAPAPHRHVHVRGARFSHAPLQGTQAPMKPTPIVHPQASDGPSTQASLQRQTPAGSLSHPPTHAHTQGRPQTKPKAQLNAQSRHKDQDRPPAQPRTTQPGSRPVSQAHPRLQPQPKVAAPPSKPVLTRRGAPAATQRAAPAATQRAAPAAARRAAAAAAPAATRAAAPAATRTAVPAAAPAGTPAAAPAQGSGYQEGQLVWARCGKSPWWPATVQDPTRAQRRLTKMGSGSDKTFVVFYGTGQIQALPNVRVARWCDVDVPKTGTRNLLKAVQSAKQALRRRAVS